MTAERVRSVSTAVAAVVVTGLLAFAVAPLL
jgi:hypothetical protein